MALRNLAKLDIEISYIAIKKEGTNINSKEKERIISRLFEEYFKDYFNGIKSSLKIKADSSFFCKAEQKKVYFLGIRYKSSSKIVKTKSGNKIIERLLEFKRVTAEEVRIIKQKFRVPVILTVEHTNSYNSNGIQAIDLITGAIHHFLNTKDETYFNIIKHKIVSGVISKPLIK